MNNRIKSPIIATKAATKRIDPIIATVGINDTESIYGNPISDKC